MNTSPVPKTDWQPTASLDAIALRARIFQTTRTFFAERHVLEVETPLLCQHTVTNPHIESITTQINGQQLYLQTSPEYAMKRLLAANSCAIYQICKAFRAGEVGRHHNPEFTLLEWYRPGYDHHALIQELDELLQTILQTKPGEKITYHDLFKSFLDINPHTVTSNELQQTLSNHNIEPPESLSKADLDSWLDLTLSHLIQPKLGINKPVYVYDYPASQAALARCQQQPPHHAERFECFYQGLELANGFHELNDAHEQRKRFEQEQIARKNAKKPAIALDERLLAALDAGIPNCAGVAVGMDRLIMIAASAEALSDIVSFPIGNA